MATKWNFYIALKGCGTIIVILSIYTISSEVIFVNDIKSIMKKMLKFLIDSNGQYSEVIHWT